MINNDSGNNKVMDQKQGDKNFFLDMKQMHWCIM